jgi:4-hydroxyphenylpyruvate dioxygenase-like putative hemolysin
MGGPVILLALRHASIAAGRDNAAALEQAVTTGHRTFRDQPWNELVDLESVETTGDGLVTIARQRPIDAAWPTLWYELAQQRDSLIVSC